MGKGSSNARERASLDFMPIGAGGFQGGDRARQESYRLSEGLLAIQHHSAPVCGLLRIDHPDDPLARRLDQVLEATTGSLNSFHRAGGRSSFSDAVEKHTTEQRGRSQPGSDQLRQESTRIQSELIEFRSHLQSIYAALRGRGKTDYADRIAQAIWSIDAALQAEE